MPEVERAARPHVHHQRGDEGRQHQRSRPGDGGERAARRHAQHASSRTTSRPKKSTACRKDAASSRSRLPRPSVNSGRNRGRLPGERRQRRRKRSSPLTASSTNSLLDGQSRQNTVFEYLQEVQVKTTGIPAEYGGALGGVISAVTKSGGNIFTGEGHYYFSGSTLSAGPVQRSCSARLTTRPSLRSRMTRGLITQRSRRIDRRPDRPRPPVLLRIVFSALQRSANERIPVSQRHRSGRDQARPDNHAGIRQGQLRQPPCQRIFRCALDADYVQGHAAGLQRHRPADSCRASKASNQVEHRARLGDRCSGTSPATWTSSSPTPTFLSVKVGHFHDHYTDTGVPLTTTMRTTKLRASASQVPACPAGFLGPTGTQNTPRGSDHRPRHDEADILQGRLQRHIPGWRMPHVEGGRGVRHNAERRRPALSRRPRRNLLG